MTQTSSTTPRAAVQGVASGMFFMAIFSTLWASIGVAGLQKWGGTWLWVIVVLIGIGIFAGGISLRTASRQLPNLVAETDVQRRKRMGIWFRIIFATEILLIVAAGIICGSINRFDLFFPIMALIVGVHFLPLAVLYQAKSYYTTGVLLCLLAIITLLLVPGTISISGQQIIAQRVVIGFGAALILWGVCLGRWLLGKSLLASSKPAETQM